MRNIDLGLASSHGLGDRDSEVLVGFRAAGLVELGVEGARVEKRA